MLKAILFSRCLNFSPDFSDHVENGLIRKLSVTSKFITSVFNCETENYNATYCPIPQQVKGIRQNWSVNKI